jgi:hypothetical protein
LGYPDFVENQVRPPSFVLTYNPGNFLRRVALPACVKHWTLTTPRDQRIKIHAKVVPWRPLSVEKTDGPARIRLSPVRRRR